MIPRYSLPEMSRIWSDENRFQKMLEIELLVCEALAYLGEIPKKDLNIIKRKARFDIRRIEKIERSTRHDVVAFLHNIAEYIGPSSRFFHQGLTSSDILDTSLSLMMREAADILLDDLKRFKAVLKEKAKKYKYTIMIGRTHGVHAEPTTFGLKMALFFDDVARCIERLQYAREVISVGKISGPVGTYSNINPHVENYVCRRLGLRRSNVSSQILQRDLHAEYLLEIALIGATLEKIATEIRNLQRTEIREVEEPFMRGQKGSSAMPHKRNPVRCERVVGLARILRSNAMASLENVSLWHERDISHSSVERVIIPDSTILLDYMLNQMIEIIDGLLVYPLNMQSNLNKTKGLIFSGRIMLELEKRGLPRQRAYDIVQRCAMQVWDKKDIGFKEALMNDRDFMGIVSREELEKFFDIHYYIRHVDVIFKRIGI